MLIRRTDVQGQFVDYEIDCLRINDSTKYPPCPANPLTDSRLSPICWGNMMSCTPGTVVTAELGVDIPVNVSYYIKPMATYSWTIIGEELRIVHKDLRILR